MEAVGAHHGRVQGFDPRGELGGRVWEQARRELLAALEAEFKPLPLENTKSEAVEWLMAREPGHELLLRDDALVDEELCEGVGLRQTCQQKKTPNAPMPPPAE